VILEDVRRLSIGAHVLVRDCVRRLSQRQSPLQGAPLLRHTRPAVLSLSLHARVQCSGSHADDSFNLRAAHVNCCHDRSWPTRSMTLRGSPYVSSPCGISPRIASSIAERRLRSGPNRSPRAGYRFHRRRRRPRSSSWQCASASTRREA
jgi:hypothetical protein